MIREIKITNYINEEKTLYLTDPESSGFAIEKIDGLGPVKANVITTNIANLDGAIFNSARAVYRNIVFSIYFVGIPDIEDARMSSYRWFPLKQKVKIVIKTDQRECECIGYVESNEPNIFSKQEKTTISIICPDPYMYSVVEHETNFSSINSLFSFPFSNESANENLIIFSDYQSKKRESVTYNGDFETGVKISMHFLGPVTDITIYHINTGKRLKIDTNKIASLTGAALDNGDNIYINTKNGEKGIELLRNGDYINILNCLDKNPDWFQLRKGDNEFAFTAESGEEFIEFSLTFKDAYEGV